MFPDVPPLHDNMTLYALLNADGTPILLADSAKLPLPMPLKQNWKWRLCTDVNQGL